jgi:peptide/nickel transport system substrate-binding protein
MIRRLCATVLLFLLLGVVSAQAEDYDPEATLTLATNAEPTLNPWTPGAVVESNLINTLIFDQLVRYDKETLAPAPALASSWEVAEDGLSWTFTLRDDVTWHDGEPFTADDVAFTFNEVVLVDELAANSASSFSVVERVEAVDPTTVRFVLSEPFSSLPYYLAYYAGILPEHVLADAENPLSVASFNKQTPVGTGAFQIAEFVSGSYVRLERNPAYWGGEPKVASVVFRIVPDPNTQLAQILAGELDMVTVSDPALLAGAENNPNLEVLQQSQNVYYFVALNQNDPRFQDVRVRQALLHAIDRQAIIDSVLRGYGEVATGPIAPLQQALYNPEVPSYPFDPERARELLAEAGWEPGEGGVLTKDGEPLRIAMPTGQFGYLVPATLLVQQYWQDIGVQVDVEVLEWNAYIQQMFVNRQYEATLAWWSTPPTPDVSPYYASEAAEAGQNIPAYRNEELDALLDAGRAATSEEEQVEVYREVQTFLAEELPYLYLWYPNIITVRNNRIGGMLEINNPAAFQYAAEWFVAR